MSTQTITVRVQSTLFDLINKARGSEPVANFMRRIVTEKLNSDQQNLAVIAEIKSLKKLIMDMAE